MSIVSQQHNMRRLHELLRGDLSYIPGRRENGPNGAKRTFLNVGKAFLQAMARDLALRDAVVKSNARGAGVSGDCILYGMWKDNGVYISVSQFAGNGENVILFRSIRNIRDHRGGHNHFISLRELETMTYRQMLDRIGALRRDRVFDLAA